MGGPSFYKPSLDQGDPFDTSVAPPSIGFDMDNSVLRELIGRLGSGDASFCGSSSTSVTTSCYTTPLNSPPNQSMMDRNSMSHLGYPPPTHLPSPVDSGFVERAVMFSCFGGGDVIGANGSFAVLPLRQVERVDPGRFSMVSNSQDATAGSRNGNSFENGEIWGSPEGSSISEQVPLQSVRNPARKRKFIPRGKAMENPATSSAKDAEDFGENEQPGDKKVKDNNVKSPEPLNDYIHVRARRGQATDSHSLAERVRREKISQRMKVLQDLVPGCNKVTGKAVMLDEIINYVQSLQRQVEFLSMKLTTLNPRIDFNVDAFLSKEMSNPLGSSFFPANSSSSVFPYVYHTHQAMHLHGARESNMENQMNALNVAVHTSMDRFCEASSTRVSGLWEDELHSIVQMGIPPNQPPPPPQKLQDTITAGHMKIEL